MPLQLDEAALISTTIEGILYGFALLMFSITAWLLLRKDRTRNYNMLVAASALIFLATCEMIVNIVRICEGFVTSNPQSNAQREDWFAKVSEPTFVIKSVIFNLQTLILDAVLIYRVWIVWQRVWIVVIPLIGWFGLLASSIGINISLATAATGDVDIFDQATGRWITTTYAITLATNILATSLLAFRIWQIDRRASAYRENPLRPILRVILESGALYSFTIIAAIVTFAIQSNGVYVILDMISPIISIVFNMIIIRVKHLSLVTERGIGPQGTGLLGVSYQIARTDRRASAMPLPSGASPGELTPHSKQHDQFGMNSLAIHVTREQETWREQETYQTWRESTSAGDVESPSTLTGPTLYTV